MTLPTYVFYRCVNRINQTWFRIGIYFFQNKSSNQVVRITNNDGKLCAISFAPFQSFLIIYRMTKAGLMRMEPHNKAGGFFLRETGESLTVSQFHLRHKLDPLGGRFSSIWLMRKQSDVKPVRKPTMSDLTELRKLEISPNNNRGEVLKHGFTPIDVSSSKEGGYPDDGVPFETNYEVTTQRKIATLLYSSSEEELIGYTSLGRSSSETTPRGVLRSNSSPSKGLKVRFESGSEGGAGSSTLCSSGSPTGGAVPCKRSGIYTLWVKACMAPLGAKGLAVLLLGLVGMILATQGGVVFYAAATMTMTGATAIGMSLFRVNRNESLQQRRNDMIATGPAILPV